MAGIFLYTLEIAVLSTLIAALIGVPASFFTARRSFLGRRFILSFSAVPLCVPPLIVALGYVTFFGVNGTANAFLARIIGPSFKPLKILYSPFGIIIAQGFYNFPLVTGILNDAWSNIPDDQERAARTLGTGEFRIFFTITLPKLSGAIAAACIPVFLFCYFSFMIVMLFSSVGKSTIEVEIYRSISTTLDYQKAFSLSIMETVTALAVVLLYSVVSRKSQTTSAGIAFAKRKRRFPGTESFVSPAGRIAEIAGFVLILLLIFIFFVCPFISIFKSGFQEKRLGEEYFSLRQYVSMFKSKTFLAAFKNSFFTGISTGFCCMLLGFIYSVIIKLTKKQGNIFLQLLPLIPMAISSVVLAWVFGLIFHKGTHLLLVVMETLLYWPIAYRQIQNGINQIDSDTDKAALMFSKNKVDSVVRIYLPASRKYLVSAFCYCFAVSMGDATLPLVLSVPRFETLALYTYRLAGNYKFYQASASGTVLTVICCLLFTFMRIYSRSDFRLKKGEN